MRKASEEFRWECKLLICFSSPSHKMIHFCAFLCFRQGPMGPIGIPGFSPPAVRGKNTFSTIYEKLIQLIWICNHPSIGEKGEQGVRGFDGRDGEAGLNGLPGLKGERGDRGPPVSLNKLDKQRINKKRRMRNGANYFNIFLFGTFELEEVYGFHWSAYLHTISDKNYFTTL